MADKKLRATLADEHQQLKRDSEELTREHQRLCRDGATPAVCAAHRIKLRSNRLELEKHYTRLRAQAEQRSRDRQQAVAAEDTLPERDPQPGNASGFRQ
jgi:hypothetical protein